MVFLNLVINRTPHFGVWSALNFGGVWITAPALHLLLQKQNFLKNNFFKGLSVVCSLHSAHEVRTLAQCMCG